MIQIQSITLSIYSIDEKYSMYNKIKIYKIF